MEQIDEWEALVAGLRARAQLAEDRATHAESRVAESLQLIAKLRDYIRQLTRGRYNRSNEKLMGIVCPHQQIIDEIATFLAKEVPEHDEAPAAGATVDPTPADASVIPGPPPDVPKDAPADATKPARKPGGRKMPSQAYPNLEIRSEILLPPEHERQDPDGTPWAQVGVEITELIAVHPFDVFIQRHIRPRFRSTTIDACVVAPTICLPAPDRIVPHGILADISIHQLAIGKYADAIPCNRTLEMFARQGCRLNGSVGDGALAAFGDLVAPVADAILASLRLAPVVFADDARIRCRDPQIKGRCRLTNMWTVTDGQEAWFHWTPDANHERAAEIVSGFVHWVTTDAWPGWPKGKNPKAKLSGCMAHARRPFALNQDLDKDAATMVSIFAELYGLEHMAEQRALQDVPQSGSPAWQEALLHHRRSLRDTASRGIMDRLKAYAETLNRLWPGAHAKGRAARYIMRHWPELTRFLDHPELRLDNNLAEGSLRIVALIRKNSLFLGHASAGPQAAASLSVLRSCRMQNVEPGAYLAAVTPILLEYRAAMKAKATPPDLAPWTPKAYAARLASAKALDPAAILSA